MLYVLAIDVPAGRDQFSCRTVKGDQMPPANQTGSTETQDTHACLPGEPARESPLLKAKVRDTETGTKESGPRAWEWQREDKHKRRETKQSG